MQMIVKEETKLNNTGSTPVIVQRNRPMIPLHAKIMMMIFFVIMMKRRKSLILEPDWSYETTL